MTITEFLEARIAESERAVVVATEYANKQMFGNPSAPAIFIYDGDGTSLWSTNQLATDCAAKRALIDAAVNCETYGDQVTVLHALASAYKDHPDYDQGWVVARDELR